MLNHINRSGQRAINIFCFRVIFVKFIQLRHYSVLSFRDTNFSDTFHHIFTNTKPIFPHSVCVASSVVAHAKNLNCWINRKIHFSSLISYRNHNKCSWCCISAYLSKNSYRQISFDLKKMVWISDLDNPQVILKGLI